MIIPVTVDLLENRLKHIAIYRLTRTPLLHELERLMTACKPCFATIARVEVRGESRNVGWPVIFLPRRLREAERERRAVLFSGIIADGWPELLYGTKIQGCIYGDRTGLFIRRRRKVRLL